MNDDDKKSRLSHPLDAKSWKEVQKKIRDGEIKVVIAGTEGVAALSAYIDQILDALRVQALVTDESTFGDFSGAQPHGIGFDAWLERLGEQLGIEIDRKTYIVEAARMLAKNANALH